MPSILMSDPRLTSLVIIVVYSNGNISKGLRITACQTILAFVARIAIVLDCNSLTPVQKHRVTAARRISRTKRSKMHFFIAPKVM